MSERSLALFLHRLLAGDLRPAGPVDDATTLARLVAQPAAPLRELLSAHLDALLAGWPGGAALRPAAIPATALWVAAALNNLAWAAARPDPGAGAGQAPRLLAVTLRLCQAMPPAAGPEAALAYHSLLRQLDRLAPAPAWQPVARQLVARSPLTAAWLPRLAGPLDWELLAALLRLPPARAALRDRWLSLLPAEGELRGEIAPDLALANAELGRLLAGLLERGAEWRPFVLAFYEADCALQRRGDDERPRWPRLAHLRAARAGDDPRRRRHAERVLARYRPLAGLLADEAALRPYLHLDPRFLVQLGELLPGARVKT